MRNIEDFKVYQKAVDLFEDFLEKDLPSVKQSFEGRILAGNQLRSLDSICANLEEGYERKSSKDTKNFFRMAKGSAGESRGRYKRFKKLLSHEIIDKRVEVLNEIRAMLESLMQKWE